MECLHLWDFLFCTLILQQEKSTSASLIDGVLIFSEFICTKEFYSDPNSQGNLRRAYKMAMNHWRLPRERRVRLRNVLNIAIIFFQRSLATRNVRF